MEISKCPRCHAQDYVKNRKNYGKQRYKCLACKYNFTVPRLGNRQLLCSVVLKKILETFQLIDANVTGYKEQRSTLKKLKHQLLDEILG